MLDIYNYISIIMPYYFIIKYGIKIFLNILVTKYHYISVQSTFHVHQIYLVQNLIIRRNLSFKLTHLSLRAHNVCVQMTNSFIVVTI